VKLDENKHVNLTVEQWTEYFKATKNELSERKKKENEEYDLKLGKSRFGKKQSDPIITNSIPVISNKRRRSMSTTDASLPEKKKRVVSFRVTPSRLKYALTNPISPPPEITPSNSPAIPSNSKDEAEPPPITAQSSDNTPSNLSRQRSASAIAHDLRVQKCHQDGVLQHEPCDRCFKSRKQCVKPDGKGCSSCLHARQKCIGAVKLYKWIDIDGRKVYFSFPHKLLYNFTNWDVGLSKS